VFVPISAGTNLGLKPYAGQKLTQVRDTIRGKLRIAIAHLDIDSDVLIQDRWEDVQKAGQVLPCLRWMARQLLDAELPADTAAVEARGRVSVRRFVASWPE
jgi:hypothetical protein